MISQTSTDIHNQTLIGVRSLEELSARIEDLSRLLALEEKALLGLRLCVRDNLTLKSLRETYPGAASRFRGELLMGSEDSESLILFALEKEDLD